MKLTVFFVCQRPVPKARHAGPEGAHAHQGPRMEGGPGGARLAAVGGQSGEVPGILGPHDGGEVLQHRCPVRPVHRSQGQPAVSVHHRGKALGKLRGAEAGAEQGVVRMAVDVQKTGGQGAPGGVNDLMGRDISQVAHCGNGAARYAHVSGDGGSAGAVQNLCVPDQIVQHSRTSFQFGTSVAFGVQLCKGGL